MGIKDDVSNSYMSDNEHFADAFNYFIYGGEQVIKPEDLAPANAVETAVIGKLEKMVTAKKTRDVIKNVTIKHGDNITYVLLGIENQSDIHYAMPVRNMLYDALNYDSQVKEEKKRVKESDQKLESAEYLSGLTKESRINPVITLVINWSNKRWDGPRKLSDMFPKTDSKVLEFVNDYELKLIDPYDINDFEKFSTRLGDVLEFIKYQDDREYYLRAKKEKGEGWLLDVDSINVINTFTDTTISTDLAEGGLVNMCKATEVFVEQGIIKGRHDINMLNTWLFDLDRVEDVKKAAIDPSVMEALIQEYNECHDDKLT
ncbi:Rpn family recombination-promoting nuclease/putative transposase [Butyrivibrio sp. AE2032]|uniref:Rpn family recombination-promoting nuclease/putative transposase n=1 Tax=Butyrivibrio sp. AE2032 TaxID=1458463 RepID=UPI00163A34E8|nr:Rpn family recombination-promoting nuclease/putative transposase [Butyrivibrio sp. AE2032]